jgi:outer membrane protein OmpA-like peptidoglycan-associated protein
MRFLMICSAATWLTCGALACGGNRPTVGDPAQNQASAGPPTRGAGAVESDRETRVEVSDEIRAECRVPQTSAESPRFELDQSTLRGPEKNLLDDVANCLKDGPLQNRTMTIVGRTDPRGSAEHNQNLGANRAEATRNYLIARGVPEERLLVMSRGEEGARGNDEKTWEFDRRVDLVLRDRNDGVVSREVPFPPANPPQTNANASTDSATAPQTTPLPPANPPQKNVKESPSGK